MSELRGKIDQIPGVCCVATEFECVAWVPIVPKFSYLVTEGSKIPTKGEVEGIQLSLDKRSVLVAFLRSWLCISLTLPLSALNPDNPQRWWALVGSVILIPIWVWSMRAWRKASPTRVKELESIIEAHRNGDEFPQQPTAVTGVLTALAVFIGVAIAILSWAKIIVDAREDAKAMESMRRIRALNLPEIPDSR